MYIWKPRLLLHACLRQYTESFAIKLFPSTKLVTGLKSSS